VAVRARVIGGIATRLDRWVTWFGLRSARGSVFYRLWGRWTEFAARWGSPYYYPFWQPGCRYPPGDPRRFGRAARLALLIDWATRGKGRGLPSYQELAEDLGWRRERR